MGDFVRKLGRPGFLIQGGVDDRNAGGCYRGQDRRVIGGRPLSIKWKQKGGSQSKKTAGHVSRIASCLKNERGLNLLRSEMEPGGDPLVGRRDLGGGKANRSSSGKFHVRTRLAGVSVKGVNDRD